MPKRGENIHKRKDGRWEARYRTGVDPTGKIIYGSVYAKTYKEAKEKQAEKLNEIAGVPALNYHALRHTFATRCIEAGTDVKSLSEMLGHANAAVTLNIYVHPSMDTKRAQLEKLAL